MADVLVVGCGLIGASIGMALREAGRDVLLHDEVAGVRDTAVQRGAGRPWDPLEPVNLVVVAVPPRATATVLKRVQDLDVARTYTHVASVQSQIQAEIEGLGCRLSAVVGGHPMAGRERSGPSAATADLFVGRPWAICASPESSPVALDDLRDLVAACGADAVELTAAEHDASVALLSHLPQLTASALAAGLVDSSKRGRDATTGRVSSGGGSRGDREGTPSAMQLSGPGLVDTTRLAASDPELWSEILELNATHLAPLVHALARRLYTAGDALATLGATATPTATAVALAQVRQLLSEGNAGRALVPVKRGARSEAFAPIRVSVRDEPGRLAGLLTDAGQLGVNVEDVHVEHVPGRPTGVIELLVAVQDVAALSEGLRHRGWTVLGADA